MATVVAVQKDGTKREKLDFLFEIWDVDGNGIVTRGEMLKIYRTLCPGLTEAQTAAAVGATFRALDKDASGTISRSEFVLTAAVNDLIEIEESEDFMARFIQEM